jgi:hypothetical protein
MADRRGIFGFVLTLDSLGALTRLPEPTPAPWERGGPAADMA